MFDGILCGFSAVLLSAGVFLSALTGTMTASGTRPESITFYTKEEDQSSAVSKSAGARGTLSGADDDVTIIMIGDMLMHMPVVRSGRKEDGSYNFDHLFAHVQGVTRSADLAIVNQETILGGEELGGYTGYPLFNSPFAVADAEAAAGFDVVLQGTNHALDRSVRGISNCLNYWETNHPAVQVLGIHDSAEDQQEICVYNVKGIRIAVLNYTYGLNGLQMPAGKGYLVDVLDQEKVLSDIERAEAMADFTVVCPHWGTEYQLKASPYQKRWAQLFLENGVDLVIGTHPHVIEPVEILEDDAGHVMPVYYSLGNFVNATAIFKPGVMNRAVGGMASVTIGRDADGKVCVKQADVYPVVCHETKESVTAYFLSDYSQALANENRFKQRDAGFSMQGIRELVEKVWPGNG